MPGPELPYIALNEHAFEKLHIDEKGAEDLVVELMSAAVASQAPKPNHPLPASNRLPPARTSPESIPASQLANGQLPPSEWGRELAHSYAYHVNWYVMLVLGGYQMEDVRSYGGTTHFSPWSYDRHVPLAFYGTPFIPGEYHERVASVDIAAMFASLVGVNQPSASIGRVLTEAMKPSRSNGK